MWDKKLINYNYDEQCILVLFDDDDNIIAYDTCISPMWSFEQCIETVFQDNLDFANQVNDIINDVHTTETTLKHFFHMHSIYFEEFQIDEFGFKAILDKIEQ